MNQVVAGIFRIFEKQFRLFRDEPRSTLTTATRYAAIGLVMNYVGIMLFLYAKDQVDIDPLLLNVPVSLAMAVLGFLPSRWLAFNDRETDARQSFQRWMVQWLPTLGVSQALFALLHEVVDIRTLLTKIIMIFTVGPLFFAITNLWAFASKAEMV